MNKSAKWISNAGDIPSHAANYFLRKTNGINVHHKLTFKSLLCGLATFVIVVLSACSDRIVVREPPPQIGTQPASVTVYETQSATFTVKAKGDGTLSYQWQKNGADISGATSVDFTALTTTLADSGASFTVAVTGSGGTTMSEAALLSVQAAGPTLLTQPTAQSVLAEQMATFSVTAAGLPPLRYQWLKNGIDIYDATSASYTTLATTMADSGQQYAVRVTNGAGTSVVTDAVALTVQPINIRYLVISEVSTCFDHTASCWFEVFNPTSSPLDLAAYQVRTTSADVSSGTVSTQTFAMPSFIVPALGYAVISGNVENTSQRSGQMLKLRTGNQVPYWTTQGFIELLSSISTTVDFVRFGANTQNPVTANQWSGDSVAALLSSETDYGKSIVRPFPDTATRDTNTSADWRSVSWSTPAGRNDVPVTALDADGDGIPDSAEVSGGTFAGIDLYAMGARTGQKDIFIEVDHMDSSDPGVIPLSASLQKVVDAFTAQGISIHFDAGTLFSSGFSTAYFNLGQRNSLVPYEPCVSFYQTNCTSNISFRRSIFDWKDEFFDLRRIAIFHYLLVGNSQLDTGEGYSSGIAEVIGNDFMVTMGHWGFSTKPGSSLNQLTNMQASTIMHELGHNLGLLHGGNDDTNYKPNYWSIMNYLYQLNGLDANPASMTAYERWKIEAQGSYQKICDLANSPCGPTEQFIMNYSNGSSAPLDETRLLESANMGRGSTSGAYADWDLNGSLTVEVKVIDLNFDAAHTGLTDYDDWGNLVLPFNRYRSVNSGNNRSFKVTRPVLNPMTSDKQAVMRETPPPARFFNELRRAN